MKLDSKVLRELQVHPGEKAALARRSTSQTAEPWTKVVGHSYPKDVAERDLEVFKEELQRAQELLYAADTWAVLLIFQALDAAGKDGTIKHVMSGVNPQGCVVWSFKQPSAEELRHDFLWRCVNKLPQRGQIGIFNRSYYEEVLVARVHPQLVEAEHLPPGVTAGKKLWEQRYEAINNFEQHLDRNGTRVVKFYLHVSKEEQRRRFLARLDDPTKRWKFSAADVAEREHFDEYLDAYEDALSATSTPWAPWHVVPADHKPAMRALVGAVVVDAIDSLSLARPAVDAQRQQELDAARAALEAETD